MPATMPSGCDLSYYADALTYMRLCCSLSSIPCFLVMRLI